jgi:hypothetical protein
MNFLENWYTMSRWKINSRAYFITINNVHSDYIYEPLFNEAVNVHHVRNETICNCSVFKMVVQRSNSLFEPKVRSLKRARVTNL